MLEADSRAEPGVLSPIVPVVTTLLIALFVIGILYWLLGVVL